MKRVAVESSNVKSVGYDPETQVLEIEFRSGVYRYHEVEPDTYHALMDAESIGRFVRQHIVDQYGSEKVVEGPQEEIELD